MQHEEEHSFIDIFLIETAVVMAGTGRYTVSGRVLDEHDLKPLPYATVKVLNLELWAITDEGGAFTIANVPEEPLP